MRRALALLVLPMCSSPSGTPCDGGCPDATADVTIHDAAPDVADASASDAPDASAACTTVALDPTFAEGGVEQLDYPPFPQGSALTIQPDGKILVGGRTDNQTLVVARFLSTGAPDVAFGTAGIATLPTAPGAFYVTAMALQTDGKIVVTGVATQNWLVERIDGSGNVDTAFGAAGFATPPGTGFRSDGVLVASDGSIYVIADQNLTSGYVFALVKFDATGQLVTAFGTGGFVTTTFNQFAFPSVGVIQPDGNILIAGHTKIPTDGAIVYDLAFARYTPTSGALDTTFGTGGTTTTHIGAGDYDVTGLVLDGTGAFFAALSEYYTPNDDFLVSRFSKTGALDTSFGSSGVARTDFFGAGDHATGLSPVGGLLLAGGVVSQPNDAGTEIEMGLAAFTAQGIPTSHMIIPRPEAWSEIDRQALQPDGKVVVTGYARATDGGSFQQLLPLARVGCP